MTEFVWFLLGWSAGAAAMWFYFSKSGLIRSREEYYKSIGKAICPHCKSNPLLDENQLPGVLEFSPEIPGDPWSSDEWCCPVCDSTYGGDASGPILN